MDKKILVLVGGSGSGKTSVANYLTANCGYRKVITTTTRSPRPGEVNGRDYHFVTEHQFWDILDNDGFVEHINYAGNMYGTSKNEIESILKDEIPAVIIMDKAGAQFMKHEYGECVYAVHIYRDKRDLILSILKRDIPNEEKAERIANLDLENIHFSGEGIFDAGVLNSNISIAELARSITSMFHEGYTEYKQ